MTSPDVIDRRSRLFSFLHVYDGNEPIRDILSIDFARGQVAMPERDAVGRAILAPGPDQEPQCVVTFKAFTAIVLHPALDYANPTDPHAMRTQFAELMQRFQAASYAMLMPRVSEVSDGE